MEGERKGLIERRCYDKSLGVVNINSHQTTVCYQDEENSRIKKGVFRKVLS